MINGYRTLFKPLITFDLMRFPCFSFRMYSINLDDGWINKILQSEIYRDFEFIMSKVGIIIAKAMLNLFIYIRIFYFSKIGY